MTSAYGRAIPLIYGKGRVQANVIYYTDFRSTESKSSQNAGGKGGGGSKQTTITYNYKVCVLFGLAEGVCSSTGTLYVGKNKGNISNFNLSYFSGSSSQAALSYIATNHPSEALSYRGTAYMGAANFDLGSDASMPSINAEVIGRSSGTNVGVNGSPDANPGDVIFDLITDTNTCLGLSSAGIGSLAAMKTYCQAAEIFVSPVYIEAKPARDMITALCVIANTGVFYSEGIAKFVPFGDVAITNNGTTYTPNLTPSYALTENDFLNNGGEPVRVIRKSQADSYNHVKVTYQNRTNDYNDDVVEAKDQASIEQNGDRLMSEVALPEVVDPTAARRVAQQILQKSSNIRNTYEFRLSWRFARLEPMDIVTLTESGLGLNAEPVRIKDIEEDDEGFLVKAEEMQVGVLHAARYSTQVSSGFVTDYNVAPGNANAPAVFEPPMSLSGSPQLWIATSGGSNWGGAIVWVSDDNATFKQVGTINGSSRHGVLTAATPSGSALDTTNTVKVDLTASNGTMIAGTTQNATDLTTLIYVGGEIMAYRDATLTATNKYTLGYLVRGAYGSPIGAHAISDKFARLDSTVFHYSYDKKFVGRTIYIKLQSFNGYGGGLQDVSTLTPVTYTFAGAQIATVANLALEQPFTGDSVKVRWDITDGAVDYAVKIYDSTGTALYRTIPHVVNNRYEYTWQDSIADGGAYRSVQIQVTANSQNGASGAASALTVANPVPAALTGIAATGGYKSISISFNTDTSPDIAGYQIWMSATSGFTPGAGNLIYDGTDNNRTVYADSTGTPIPTAATTYYFRVAAYDKFGKTGLNVSSELSVTSLLLATGINTGDITATMIASGALDMTKFASGIRPPRVVSSLPAVDGTIYKNGDTVTLTTDGQLYRAFGGAWVNAVPSVNITGTLTNAQLAAIDATKITGTLTDAQLAAISAAKVTGQITTTQITNNSVTTGKIAASAVTANEIAASTITATQIAANAITTSKLAAGSVVTSVLAAGAVTANEIASNAITTAKLAAGSVVTSVLAAGAVTANEIAANTITAAKISAGAIGAAQVAAGAITTDKLYVAAGGAALNSNPNCNDATAWTNTTSGYSLGTVTDGVSGTGVLRTSTARNTNWPTSTVFPITAGKTYRVQAWARSVNASPGNLYLRCVRINSSGSDVGSTGNTGLENFSVTGSWVQYIGTFVAEATAVNAQLVAPANWGGTANTSYIEIQDFRCEEFVPGTLIMDGAITTTKVAALAIDAGKIAANTITAAQIAALGIDATRIDTRNLTIKDGAGTTIFSAGVPLTVAYADNALKNSQISIAANGALAGGGGGAVTIGGLGYSGDLAATKNTVTYSSTAPASPGNGDVWVDTSATPNITKIRVSGAWQIGANYVTNTNQVTDGANLGGTSTWAGVSGAGKAADNATVGATFGTNISGQITSANASTFIAAAAINTAQIGTLNASVITAGTITTDRIQVGAVSNAVLLSGASTSLTVTAATSSATIATHVLISASKAINGSSILYGATLRIQFSTSATLANGTYIVNFYGGGNTSSDNGAGANIITHSYAPQIQVLMYLTSSSTYSFTATALSTLANSSLTGTRRWMLNNPNLSISTSTGGTYANGLTSASVASDATFLENKV